ncbi:hypothetical protein SPRG_16361 [Saprolegnia parasitica CBS 223.65]|uniref:Uncharacterized protein n=1 Tax=Saprolegnia parasitica (strain CBS 223.65) TaxID=695850 RepID=A0A067BN89_SAPPC|nr:hypothetical protein SPRG_16361 [Saprolegnia parasitica CBS 223.65]KDO18190.1 hypothetical protein SPRG_16361 [Saprolegnia parasitica CBS 223.65]|eukprot:XP_012211103.1 hypothetical protein SPRG_16361 [Saprolegnia parasitica CBS 223.65]
MDWTSLRTACVDLHAYHVNATSVVAPEAGPLRNLYHASLLLAGVVLGVGQPRVVVKYFIALHASVLVLGALHALGVRQAEARLAPLLGALLSDHPQLGLRAVLVFSAFNSLHAALFPVVPLTVILDVVALVSSLVLVYMVPIAAALELMHRVGPSIAAFVLVSTGVFGYTGSLALPLQSTPGARFRRKVVRL